ncbi:MAG: hypothetical protein IAI50_20410, partial [Candidatus Eremiobacteraeota bacterium]|nr:hypothetical protein [Candidatus Eremiobacteraeota bacterium]
MNAYCEAIDVPNFDEAAIASRRHPATHSIVRSHARLKMAVVAATVALVVVLCDIPAVVAGVQRVFAAFTIAAGQQKPMTIRAVELARARADMPF